MNTESTICWLRELIQVQLSPLITNDYVLWDLPYHSNIGDTLIWEGECSFLGTKRYKCLNYASAQTCTFPSLSPNILILLHGGGNFGDVWRKTQDFRLKVIKHYPHNRIILFPQTVFYQAASLIKQDAEIMAKHKDLVLCARDRLSYEFLKSHFQNMILLVPDMAFCISPDILIKYKQRERKRFLFVKRTDKELASASYSIEGKGLPIDVRDWPSMEGQMLRMFLFEKELGLNRRFYKWGWDYLYRCNSSVINWYAQHFLRPALVKTGVRFVSRYHYVYTTRLHVMILSVLLGKECTFFDNSYGKNSAFYETWLKDLPGVKIAEETGL